MSGEKIRAVLRRAAEDRAFRDALMAKRESALNAFELSPAEKALLMAPADEQFEKMIEQARKARPGRPASQDTWRCDRSRRRRQHAHPQHARPQPRGGLRSRRAINVEAGCLRGGMLGGGPTAAPHPRYLRSGSFPSFMSCSRYFLMSAPDLLRSSH